MSDPLESARLKPAFRPKSTLPLSKSMLAFCPPPSPPKSRVATSSPLNPPHIASALPLRLLMSNAAVNPVHAASPKLFCVEVCRNVAPLPLADHPLPQPPLLCFAHEYDSPDPDAPAENAAAVPLQTVVFAGCDEIAGAAS